MKQTFAALLFLAAAGAIAVAQQPPQPLATPVPVRPPIVELFYQAARARTDDEATKFLTQARTLLGQGADVRGVDADGRNCLHWLSIASDDARRTRLGDTYGDLTEALIDAGAEVGRPDHYGVMPLDWQPPASNSAFVMVMQGQQAPRAATAPLGDEIATLLARLHAMTAKGDLSGTRPEEHRFCAAHLIGATVRENGRDEGALAETSQQHGATVGHDRVVAGRERRAVHDEAEWDVTVHLRGRCGDIERREQRQGGCCHGEREHSFRH